ncbi:MAG TPA: hypothetical protein VFN68_13600 [Acidimicrobiales bacterium]|nr:hypothetical protein [Acidimicrobiales bacterium]
MFKRFGLGFAVGYVFGAQAGQKRYEEMTEVAQRVVDLPLVQRVADQARDLATADAGRRLIEQVRSRGSHNRSGDGRDAGDGGDPDDTYDDDAYDDDAYDEQDEGADDSYEDDDEGYADADADDETGSEESGEVDETEVDDDADDADGDDDPRSEDPDGGPDAGGGRRERPHKTARRDAGRREERRPQRSGSRMKAALERGRVD